MMVLREWRFLVSEVPLYAPSARGGACNTYLTKSNHDMNRIKTNLVLSALRGVALSEEVAVGHRA